LAEKTIDFETELRTFFENGEFAQVATLAIERYGQELLRYLMGMLRDEQEAEEIFAQTCLLIWNGIEKFQWRSEFRTWAFAIAHHTCARYLRKKDKFRLLRIEDVPNVSALVARVRTQTRPYLRSDMKSQISKLREQLTFEEQSLLCLRIDRKMSWQEVAEVSLAGEDTECQDEQALKREARSCRKRFERTKTKLKHLAEEAGLLD